MRRHIPTTFCAAREVEKEEVIDLSCSQTTDKQSKPKVTSFFPLQKWKGTQPTKTPMVRGAHLEEEEGSNIEVGAESEDPDGLNSVMEEFIICLARAGKQAQQEEKHCYHCSSKEHFICECPLVKASRSAAHLNQKEGMVPDKGAQTPQVKVAKLKVPQEGMPKAYLCHKQTPFLNSDPFLQWYGVKNIAKVRINGERCMALLDNGMQINMITPSFVEEHSLNEGPLTDLVGGCVTCVGLGNALTQPLGYIVIWVHMDGVQGYDKDQIALVIPDLSDFAV